MGNIDDAVSIAIAILIVLTGEPHFLQFFFVWLKISPAPTQ